MQERRRGDRKHRLIAIFAFLLSFYLTLFVWPTPWRYDQVGKSPVRTNRVTGEVEILTLQGWQPALPPLDVFRVRRRPSRTRETKPCEGARPGNAPSARLGERPRLHEA